MDLTELLPNADLDPSMVDSRAAEIFDQIVRSRRSVRIYDETLVPAEVIHRALDHAMLAPNSSNMQPWEFFWARTTETKSQLAVACLSQPAATTAAELVVFTARADTWRMRRKQMLKYFAEQSAKGVKIPNSALQYYGKLIPLNQTMGPFSVLGWVKRLIFFIVGLFRAVPREPVSATDNRIVRIKTTALAAENFMLSIRAQGFDTCPMEGFDSKRVRNILKLKRSTSVVMIISVGKRKPSGIYGQRIRFPRHEFVKEC